MPTLSTIVPTRSAQALVLLDTTAPLAPTISVDKNAAGYIVGDTPYLVGIAEANSTVNVYSGNTLLGTTVTDAQGFWKTPTTALADGSYTVFATATDPAGNISVHSANLAFSVDTVAPSMPGAALALTATGNQPVFSGGAEPGTTLSLLTPAGIIGQQQVAPNGIWSIGTNPLPDGSYTVIVQSMDAASNATNGAAPINFTIASPLNHTGTAHDDVLVNTPGNNFFNGLGGIDTLVYAGTWANHAIDVSGPSATVRALTGSDGLDALQQVERLSFADATVAIDIAGNGGAAFRLYHAAFDRAPDLAGLGYWIGRLDAGASEHDVATGFVASAEFATLYGASPSSADFVAHLYANVLHRAPDANGLAFWTGALDQHGAARADVLVAFSDSAENVAQLTGVMAHGIAYIPYG